MRKFLFTKQMKASVFLLLMFFGSLGAYAQMNCVQNHQIAFNENCQAVLSPQDVLQGNYDDYSIYSVEIFNSFGQAMGTNIADVSMLEGLWQVRVTNTTNNNYCTASGVDFIDLLGPAIDCDNAAVTVSCEAELTDVAPPTAVDNCTSTTSIQLIGESYQDDNICDDNQLVLARTWQAYDGYGNASEPCTQLITIERAPVVFPKDIVWTVEQYNFNTSILNAEALSSGIFDLDENDGQDDVDVDPGVSEAVLNSTGSGYPSGLGSATCEYSVGYTDQWLAGCGEEFKILRTWTILDECTLNSFSDVQVISVEGNSSITLDLSQSNGYVMNGSSVEYHVSANVSGQGQGVCRSTGFILYPSVVGGSSGVDLSTMKILTPVGELVNTSSVGGFIPSPGIAIGTYPDGLLVQVSDECGNQTTLSIDLIVEDDIVPTAICDQITKVGLNGAQSIAPASVFDDGSYDNCCIDHFEVKRLNTSCPGSEDDLSFGPTISFCCEDIGQDVDVVMRVVDCYNNTNECQVVVEVEDLNPPNCFAPADVQVDCHQFDFSLTEYGEVVAVDNCGTVDSIIETVDWSQFNNACQSGQIVKSWSIWDESGNSSTCSQTIIVENSGVYTVKFPDDRTDNVTDTILPVYSGNCGVVSWSVHDEKFIPLGQCFGKIYRTFKIYNGCDFDLSYPPVIVSNPSGTLEGPTVEANTQNHGVFTYTQEIDIFDEAAPTASCNDVNVCTKGQSCAQDVSLSVFAKDDFVSNAAIGFAYYYELDMDDDGAYDMTVSSQDANAPAITKMIGANSVQANINLVQIPKGQHHIVWSLTDGCGHTSTCESYFTVEDCEAPTLTCKPLTSSLELQSGSPGYTVKATDLIASLSDNCSITGMEYAMTQNGQPVFGADPSLQLDCDNIGVTPMQVWARDAAGNASSCNTTITLDDANNVCNTTTVEGFVRLDNGVGIEKVLVEATPGNPDLDVFATKTDANGHYSFNLPKGSSYLLKLTKLNDTYQNGVEMDDAQILLNHVMGWQNLPNAYKVLAANVRNNNMINIPEVATIKALVLEKISGFSDVPIWDFADAGVAFPDMNNPFSIHYDGHLISLLSAPEQVDFIGLKYGDLNNTVNTLSKMASPTALQNRLDEKAFIQMEDIQLVAGEDYVVPVALSSKTPVTSYQFTLAFDPEMLEVLDVVGDPQKVEENFNLAQIDEGLLATADIGQVASNQPLFELHFKAKQSGLLSQIIRLSDEITKSKGFVMTQAELGLELEFLESDKTQSVVLFQNQPNPFVDVTSIGFKLSQAQNVKLTLFAQDGRVVEKREKYYPPGTHYELFHGRQFPERGVYFYRLETDDVTLVKKMVKLNE